MIHRVEIASGIRLSYRETGEAHETRLVQVHGIGTGHRNYDLLTPHLMKTLHVYDLDLPGYGDSEEAPHRRSLWEFADDVAQFIEALRLAPVHVHGTSMGGAIAMLLAAYRRELVDRLVVTCSFARFDRAAHAMFGTWRLAACLGGIEALATITSHQGFSRSFWDRPESEGTRDAFVAALSGTTPEEFLRDLVAIEGVDISENAQKIRTPTLLLGADEDIITPVKAASSGGGMGTLHELIPSSELKVFSECGHFISIERPEETAREISHFLLGG